MAMNLGSTKRDLPVNRRIRMDDDAESQGSQGASSSDKSRRFRKQGRADGGRQPGGSKWSFGWVGRMGQGLSSRVHGLRAAVSIVFVVAASIALAWGIKQHVVSSPRFAVKTIRVEGAARRTVEQVSKAAGIAIGDNIFTLDLERTRTRLLQDPWIEQASVQRKLPSTVMISVIEREAHAVVAVDADLYLCTAQGELFKKLELEDPSDLVVISGITALQVAADRKIAQARVRGALDLLTQYETRGPAKQHPAQQVHLQPDGSARMVIGNSAVELEMGRPPYRTKVLRAERVLREVQRQKAEPAVVFLDNEAHPERVVVRMR